MRLFFSLFLSDEIIDELLHVQDQFRKYGVMRCSTRENLHITLKFFEDAEPDLIEQVVQHVKFKPFSLTLFHLGSFDTNSQGSVLWVTFHESKELTSLKKDIDNALPYYKDDHPFKSHVTLARISSFKNKTGYQEEIRRIKLPQLQMTVTSFNLMKSELGSGLPKYQVVKTFPLR
jgi:2'-5' RNA ligase